LANHKSAKKRAIQNVKKRMHNMTIKTKMKNAIKLVRKASTDNAENAVEILNKAKSVIAVSAKKGVINKKNMSRKISRLAKLVNSMNA